MFKKLRSIANEYPRAFWILIGGTFIDNLGRFFLFPFFALYVTNHFGVGMTEVGFLFMLLSIGHLVGGPIGGALTDKFGRKSMLLFGLLASGMSSLLMGLIDDLTLFYAVAGLMGLLANAGGPAQQAMVADLLPEEKRAEGFGMLRVTINLSAVIGPGIGGFLASQNYFYLFVSDAILSTITAIIVFVFIPETKPESVKGQKEQTIGQTILGYRYVLKDILFMGFLMAMMLMELAYLQLNSTLSVYLRDRHGFADYKFGWLLSLNALMVVVFQFWVTRRISKYPPMFMMAIGTVLYCIGFVMYGFVSVEFLFFLAMVILTVGEIIIAPFGHALAAQFAPEDKRGRYMAVMGFTWTIPSLFGVLAAGYIMDNLWPQLVWYIAGLLCIMSSMGYLLLHKAIQRRFRKTTVDE